MGEDRSGDQRAGRRAERRDLMPSWFQAARKWMGKIARKRLLPPFHFRVVEVVGGTGKVQEKYHVRLVEMVDARRVYLVEVHE